MPLKILHIIPDLRKGGAERLTLNLCSGLQGRGHEVKLLLFRNQNEYAELSKDLPVVVHRPAFRFHALHAPQKEFKTYKEIVNAFQPSVIHSHLYEAEFISRECLFPGVKYFSHLHDRMPPLQKPAFRTFFHKRGITDFLERRHLMNQYVLCRNRFIANSKHTLSFYERNLPEALAGRMVCLPNAVDLKAFGYREPLPPDEPIRLLTVGSLVEKKNHSFLLQVMKKLREAGRKVRLDVLGEGPCRNSLEAGIQARDLSDSVTLHGNSDHVESWLHRSHIYVHAATYEPFGLSLLEAMACGRPVVALDGGGNRELLADNHNGYLVKQNHPDAFAAQIMKLIDDESTYRMFSRHAYETARRCGLAADGDRLLEIYAGADA